MTIEEDGTALESDICTPNEAAEPTLIIDIYVPLPFAFGTHGGASEAPTQ